MSQHFQSENDPLSECPIFIRTLCGKIYTVHYNENSTVLDIKKKLEKLSEKSIDKIRLILGQTVLRDDWNFCSNPAIDKLGGKTLSGVGVVHIGNILNTKVISDR